MTKLQKDYRVTNKRSDSKSVWSFNIRENKIKKREQFGDFDIVFVCDPDSRDKKSFRIRYSYLRTKGYIARENMYPDKRWIIYVDKNNIFNFGKSTYMDGNDFIEGRNITKKVIVNRKYGSGGEGEGHRKLKEWIAENPTELGLANIKEIIKEYGFVSGDAADIVFELDGNKWVIVEVETLDPNPGGYQALKYRVLKCAELGLDITSPNVEGVLVAWSIPEEVKIFCNKYGIRFFEKKL